MKTFRLSFKLLDRTFHGRKAASACEWPPSPLRAIQALVDAAVNRWRSESHFNSYAKPALMWLESLAPPEIKAPLAEAATTAYRLYVPNNHADVVAAAWKRGKINASIAEHKTEKDVRPMHLGDGDTVHYVWSLSDPAATECQNHVGTLAAAARSITHLGWGIDMVAGNAGLITDAEAALLPGERWLPSDGGAENNLRVPQVGTLDDLVRKHSEFLNRLSKEGFKPVEPLRAFHIVNYRRATDPTARPFAAFSLLQPDASGFQSFDPLRYTRNIAGMVRCATAKAAKLQGWPQERIDSFIHGHGAEKDGQATTDERLFFLPLPSITPLKVERLRRVLVVGPPGYRIQEVQRLLMGAELIAEDEAEPSALLSLLPQSDRNVTPYTMLAKVWSTVTPVLLPGYDDPKHLRRKLKDNQDPDVQKRYLERLDARMFGLLKKAFRQAGFAAELVDQAELEWRHVGFRRGVELASRYLRPKNLEKFPAYHVRVRFPQAIPGPLAVGAGRYRGLGVFVAEDAR